MTFRAGPLFFTTTGRDKKIMPLYVYRIITKTYNQTNVVISNIKNAVIFIIKQIIQTKYTKNHLKRCLRAFFEAKTSLILQ